MSGGQGIAQRMAHPSRKKKSMDSVNTEGSTSTASDFFRLDLTLCLICPSSENIDVGSGESSYARRCPSVHKFGVDYLCITDLDMLFD